MRHILPALVCAFLACVGPTAAQEAVPQSTDKDQVGLELTVYNSNLGLVKDLRKIALPKGEGELRFMDVAAHIMPQTVFVKSLNQPESFGILEQNYEYDLINASKLLDKYVGKKIKIVDWNKFQDRKEVVDATLLSNNNGPVYMIDNEIYLGHPGTQILPKLPENLIAKPTLTWVYQNAVEQPHTMEVSYLTKNIGWKADYVVMVNKDDTSADISGWVTLDNKSGATYKDARLKLVAGDVNRVEEDASRRYARAPKAAMALEAAPQFQEKAFFEYHLYDLQRKTTVKDNQTKQISLLNAHSVGINKEFLVHGINAYYTQQFTEKQPKLPVNVFIKFKNSKENKLGMPLPEGTMRLYKQDTDSSRQFIGEDKIKHTPKDEEVTLKIGQAFDVTAERKQTAFKQITNRLFESEWKLTLRNHKDIPITVGVIEPLLGNWEIVETSMPFKKLDAHTVRFDAAVPKDGESTITYRVKVGL